MSDGRDALLRQITDDLVEIITAHVQREMADADDKELAAFQTFVAKEVDAARAPRGTHENSDLLDVVIKKARDYKKK